MFKLLPILSIYRRATLETTGVHKGFATGLNGNMLKHLVNVLNGEKEIKFWTISDATEILRNRGREKKNLYLCAILHGSERSRVFP